jgi:hypothetical protein
LKDQKHPKNVVFEYGFVMAFAAPDEQVADLFSFQVSSALLLLFGCVHVSVSLAESLVVQLD